jgi:hypothetical protein
MFGYRSVLAFGGTIKDQDYVLPHRPLLAMLTLWLPAGALGAKRRLNFLLEPNASLPAESLIDRLMAHTHLQVVGKFFLIRLALI